MVESRQPSRPALHIRNRVEAFLRRTGMSATRLGQEAVGDPRLVNDLRGGREPRALMTFRIEHFMNKHEETR